MTEFAFPDAVGIVGVLIVLATFFLVQSERLQATSRRYQLLNMLACLLIGVSLYFTFNWPSAVIQAFWFLISFYGFLRGLSQRRAGDREPN